MTNYQNKNQLDQGIYHPGQRKLSIGTYLQFAINECINANTVPDILKEAYVTRIYKRGDRHNPENYQPILITPTLALLELLSGHLDMNKISNKN